MQKADVALLGFALATTGSRPFLLREQVASATGNVWSGIDLSQLMSCAGNLIITSGYQFFLIYKL
jgi:hypothetical protein